MLEKFKLIFIFCNPVLCNDVYKKSKFINIDIDDEQTEPMKDPQPFFLELPFRWGPRVKSAGENSVFFLCNFSD